MFDQIFCSSLKNQLFMLEFLVHELKVLPLRDKYINNSLYVALKIANLPVLIVKQEDFITIKQNKSNLHTNDTIIHFDVGKSCLFSSSLSELKNWIEEIPLELNIYKEILELSNEEEEAKEKEENRICGTQISLSDCDFDKLTQKNILNHVIELKNINDDYNVYDNENQIFGTIKIFLRLSCFGKLIITKFAWQNNSFLFKTGQSVNEFKCSKISLEEKSSDDNMINTNETESVENIQSQSTLLNTGNILGLHLLCEDLTQTCDSTLLNVPRKRIMVEEQNSMMFKHKENLLSGSKAWLNDSSLSCKKKIQNNVKNNTCCQNYSQNDYDRRLNMTLEKKELLSKYNRLRGGACDKNDHKCRCNKNNINHINDNQENKCTGDYSFQKYINEAQDILNELGNKNGLAGLGILSSLESPYFGRKRDYENLSLFNNYETSDVSTGFSKDKHFLPSQKDIVLRDNELKSFADNVPYPSDKGKKKKSKPAMYENDNDFKMVSNDKIAAQSNNDTGLKENLSNMNDQNMEISTVFRNNYAKSFKKNKTKRKRKEVSRKKNISDYKVKPYNSSVTCSSSYNPQIKVSKRIMKHAYDMRNLNPGIYHGHRNCIDLNMRIPANMGWLWNTCDNPGIQKPRYGWKPGAISKYVYNILMNAKSKSVEKNMLDDNSVLSNPDAKKSESLKSKSLPSVNQKKQKSQLNNIPADEEPPPLIQVQRRDGDYYVTINPAKQGESNVKPYQLKISKNENDADIKSNSTAPDFQMAVAPPNQPPVEDKVETKEIETQVMAQEIIESTKSIKDKKPAPSKGKKPKGKK